MAYINGFIKNKDITEEERIFLINKLGFEEKISGVSINLRISKEGTILFSEIPKEFLGKMKIRLIGTEKRDQFRTTVCCDVCGKMLKPFHYYNNNKCANFAVKKFCEIIISNKRDWLIITAYSLSYNKTSVKGIIIYEGAADLPTELSEFKDAVTAVKAKQKNLEHVFFF